MSGKIIIQNVQEQFNMHPAFELKKMPDEEFSSGMKLAIYHGTLLLAWHRRFDKFRQVVFDLGQRGQVDVHHMTGFIVAHADVAA